MTQPTAPLTPNQFRKQLIDEGKTLKQWAIDNGYTSKYDQEYCSRVLTGAVKGLRGKGHDIAVAMGIKADPAQSSSATTNQATGEDA